MNQRVPDWDHYDCHDLEIYQGREEISYREKIEHMPIKRTYAFGAEFFVNIGNCFI